MLKLLSDTIYFPAKSLLFFALVLLLQACGYFGQAADVAVNDSTKNTALDEIDKQSRFTIAVVPDTQNYLDYKHQKARGFALDASNLFIQQMRYIANRSVNRGGDIAFVAAVGDVWQHQSKPIDQDHADRGFEVIANPFFSQEIEATDQTVAVELPKAVEGYQLLHEAGVPFGVAPGNHDYDAMWSASGFPANVSKPPRELTMTPEDLGMLHIGGLDNFRSVFGNDKAFFTDKPWYVDSFRGGANSAQLFKAGGYLFLNFALEMQADNEVLAWMEKVLLRYPNVPTLITTHDFLDAKGERQPNPIVDLERVDPDFHNSAEALWQKLIRQHDQIFLVLCGHHHGQAMRVDNNVNGNQVIQVLADYQDRGQAGIDRGQALSPHTGQPIGIGDGWFRLMTFDFTNEVPRIDIKTYSTYYNTYSSTLSSYAQWYREHEQKMMSDAEFYASDEFTIELSDFYRRFGKSAQ